MSKESLASLIISEAKLEAEKIQNSARQKVEKIKLEGEEKISTQKIKLKTEFEKKRNILEASKNAKISSMKKASNLTVIHKTLDLLKKRSAEILLSDSLMRDYLVSWSKKWDNGKLSVGLRISESLPEIISNAKKRNLKIDDQAPDYAIVFAGNGYNEVLDLINTCGRVVEKNADKFVAILTSS